MRTRLLTHRGPRQLLANVTVIAAALVLAACGTPTPTHLYSLMPNDVVPSAAAAASAIRGLPIVLEHVRVPTQVDQPQWLVHLPDDSVAVLEQERWASPLRDEFRAALLEQLIVGYGAIDARTRPAPGSAPWHIMVDVRRFDSLPGVEARIEGSWILHGSSDRAVSSRCEWLLREAAPGPLPALAAAHRRAVARLGDAIALALSRLARGETPACPTLDERR